MKIRPFNVSDSKPQVEPALDQSQIVRAALDLLDEVGFDGLTMRNLAKKLGIQAASLYWHVRNKQDLLSLLAEEICASMREPDRTLSWQEQLEAMGNEYRRVLLAHRDGARVLAGRDGKVDPLDLLVIIIHYPGHVHVIGAGVDSVDARAVARQGCFPGIGDHVAVVVGVESDRGSSLAAIGRDEVADRQVGKDGTAPLCHVDPGAHVG